MDSDEKWAAQCEAWDKQLNLMSEQFMAGVAVLALAGKALPMGYEYLAPLTR